MSELTRVEHLDWCKKREFAKAVLRASLEYALKSNTPAREGEDTQTFEDEKTTKLLDEMERDFK